MIRHLGLAAGLAGALALGAAAPVFAQNCVDLCTVSCVKPISIPDRWDDVTGIPGYMGGTKRPNWRGNNAWDSESITNDVNGNGLYDPGDGYTDGNANGIYDAEAYDPATTGYEAAGDIGLELTLKFDNDSKPTPGQFQAIEFPSVNRGTPVGGIDPYQGAWTNCDPSQVGIGDALQLEPGNMVASTNPMMINLIASDPGAYWDPVTSSVQGSNAAQSPRVIFLAVHDPRIPIAVGFNKLVVTKVVAFFMGQMAGNATVTGRFVRAIGSGSPCASDGAGFIVECPTPARATSWGRVKDLYR